MVLPRVSVHLILRPAKKYYLTNEQGEQLGSGAYIGTVPVPMSKEDECTMRYWRNFPLLQLLSILHSVLSLLRCYFTETG